MANFLHRRHSSQRSSSSIPRKNPPAHRHAAPSGPWPFLNLDDTVEQALITAANSPSSFDHGGFAREQMGSFGGELLRLSSDVPERGFTPEDWVEEHDEPPPLFQGWKGYPQSHFPNWSSSQQARSGIKNARRWRHPTKVFRADIQDTGQFLARDNLDLIDEPASTDAFWEQLNIPRAKDTILRAYFVDEISGPALQMLGSRFFIEPFFFSSFLKWIPSRHFQEESPDQMAPRGEHITVTLSFIRSIKKADADVYTVPSKKDPDPRHGSASQAIDIQEALVLDSQEKVLVHDFMALHLIRVPQKPGLFGQPPSPESSTLISLHPHESHRATSASLLHGRFMGVGRSVYWSSMLSGKAIPHTTKLVGDRSPRMPTSHLAEQRLSHASPPGMRRRNSGPSGHVRRNSNDPGNRRRGSRSESTGLGLFDLAPIAHRRQNSIGSLALPQPGPLWLEDVEEDAVAEDDDEGGGGIQRPRRDSPSAISDSASASPPTTPPAQSGGRGQHLSVSPSAIQSPHRNHRSGPFTPTQDDTSHFPSGSRSSPQPISDSPQMRLSPLPVDLAPNINVTPSENNATMAADSALVLLAMLWHAVYCWDEAFDDLSAHVGILESETLALTSGADLKLDPEDISELHTSHSQSAFIIQAHLLHYASLLADFRKSVGFIEGAALGTGGESLSYVNRLRQQKRGDSMGYGAGGQKKKRQDTYSKFGGDADDQAEQPFLGMEYEQDRFEEDHGHDSEESSESNQEQNRKRTIRSESAKLVDEIERMERHRGGLENRLKNLVNLAYSRINLEDSLTMQRLTEASLRDTAAMKQISYLSMVFLPATLAASLFGMNIQNLKPGTAGTLVHYFETVLPLSMLTIWFVVAMQFVYSKRHKVRRTADGTEVRERKTVLVYDVLGSLTWPIILFRQWMAALDPQQRLERAIEATSVRLKRFRARRDPWDSGIPQS